MRTSLERGDLMQKKTIIYYECLFVFAASFTFVMQDLILLFVYLDKKKEKKVEICPMSFDM